VLERFFEARVMAIPFKPNHPGFRPTVERPFRILRDSVIELEILPSFAQQYQLKWSIQFCLTVPPSASIARFDFAIWISFHADTAE
jgi:mediator of RNA polymerase II transcription subunit 14